MIEESLLKSNFLGRDGFIWWIGQVAPLASWRNQKSKPDAGENKKPEKDKDSTGGSWAYRCKVRIVGYHTWDGDILPDIDLPWAHVSMTPENGSGQGGVGKTNMLTGGETVYGFFLDGEDAQQPVIVGCLYRNESTKSLITPEFLQKEKSSQFKPFTGHQGPLIQGQTQIREKNTAQQSEPQTSTTPVAGIGSTSTVGDPVPASREANKPGADQLIRRSSATQQFVAKGCEIKVVRENGCNDNIIGKISKVLQDFISFVNRIEGYIGQYVDPILNKAIDLTNEIRGFATRIVGIVKFIINNMRNGIIGLVTKLFGQFIGLVVPLPQQPPIASATKNIIDIIFCVFEKLLPLLLNFIINMLTNMVGKAINAPLCAVEQFTASILSKLIDLIDNLLKPIFSGLNWLLGAIGQIKDILGKVSSLAQQILSFISCDRLKCETPIEWSPCGGPEKKGSDSWSKTLNNVSLLKGINSNLDAAMGYMSLYGFTGNSPFKSCTEKTLKPKTQKDQIPMPIGVQAPNCIPPEVRIFGDGVQGQAVAIVDNNGSILSIEVLNRGKGYTKPPTITIVDNTNTGSGAQASAKISNGRITSIFITNKGQNYCKPSTGQEFPRTPTYLVTANKYSFYEGESVTYTITTTDIPDGTILDYEFSGDVTISDFQGLSSFSGKTTINSNKSTVTVKFKQDNINENSEIVNFDLFDLEGIKVARAVVIVNNELSPTLFPEPNNPIEVPPGTQIPQDAGGTGEGDENIDIIPTPITPGITTEISPGGGGIGTSIVGIITDIVIDRPGTGYTGGDTINVGICTFGIIVTPSGSIIGITSSSNCQQIFEELPDAIINTNTGEGASVFPVLKFSPQYSTQRAATVNQLGVLTIVDCI
jgi:hypothetical protein